MIGPDPKINQTCVVLTLTPAAKEMPRKAVDLIYNTALESGVPKDSIHMGGPPVDNVALDKEGERMLLLLAGLSGLIGLALSWWYMQNARLTAIVLGSSVYGAALSLAIVTFTGNTMDSILLNMPSIVYTMGMSGAIHIINYWRHNAAQYGMEGAATRGLKMAWLPCLLSASTTSLGLDFTLHERAASDRQVWFLCGGGRDEHVDFALHVCSFGAGALGTEDSADRSGEIRSCPTNANKTIAAACGGSPRLISCASKAVWASFMIVMVVCGYGLTRFSTTVNLMALFSKNSEIVHSYSWLEDHLGPLVPMEIVVRLDEKNCNLDVSRSDATGAADSAESGNAQGCRQLAVGRHVRRRSRTGANRQRL